MNAEELWEVVNEELYPDRDEMDWVEEFCPDDDGQEVWVVHTICDIVYDAMADDPTRDAYDILCEIHNFGLDGYHASPKDSIFRDWYVGLCNEVTAITEYLQEWEYLQQDE